MSSDFLAFLIGAIVTSLALFYIRISENKSIKKELQVLNEKKKKDREEINKISNDLRNNIKQYRKLRTKRRPKGGG